MSGTQNPPVIIERPGPGCLISLIWFIFIGSWLSFFWILVAWALTVLIITMPIGLWMLHRVPLIATLRSPSQEYIVTAEGGMTRVHGIRPAQHPFILRAIYFLLIGWWLSLIWVLTAWAATGTIILLPLALWMMNRVPAVATLERY